MNHGLQSKTYNALGTPTIPGSTVITDSLGANAKLVGIILESPITFGGTASFVLATKVSSVITIFGWGSVNTTASSLVWWAGEGSPNAAAQSQTTLVADTLKAFLPKGAPIKWNEAGLDYDLILQVTTTGFGNAIVLYTEDDVPREGFHG
tara:strand:+ start:5309 stop:5758 length:450 start_codon:yes stop_codon:yes gene_type:complete